jgi:DNA replication protein DnaD
MTKVMLDYTKSILERVSFNPELFKRELQKAIKTLLPYEMEYLKKWLLRFTYKKPELKPCLLVFNT